MGCEDVGVVRLPLKEVTALCQVGQTLTKDTSVHLFVQGTKRDATQATYLVTLANPKGQGERVLRTAEISGDFFEGAKSGDIKDLHFCCET
jgi:hypothetical protein